jgi:hypothetical protein
VITDHLRERVDKGRDKGKDDLEQLGTTWPLQQASGLTVSTFASSLAFPKIV